MHKGTIHHLVGTSHLLFHDERKDIYFWAKGAGNMNNGKFEPRSIESLKICSPPSIEKVLDLIDDDVEVQEFFVFNMELFNEARSKSLLQKDWPRGS